MIDDLLTPTSKRALNRMIQASFLLGAAFFCLLMVLSLGMDELGKEAQDFRLSLLYVLAVAAMLATDRWHRLANTRLAIEIVTHINTSIAQSLFALEYTAYETLDKDRILSVISEDSRTTSDGIDAAARFFLLFVLQVAEVFYLAFLSTTIFVVSLTFLIIIYLFVALLLRRIVQLEDDVSAFDARLYHGFDGLLFGFKELRLNQRKKQTFLQTEIAQPLLRMAEEKQREKYFLSLLFVLCDVSLLLFAGLFIMLIPMVEADKAELAARGGLIILFFPMALFMELPTVSRAALALGRLRSMMRYLEGLAPPTARSATTPNDRFDVSGEPKPVYTSAPLLACEEVIYHYPDREEEAGFSLGPVTFAIEPGTITFLVGGNGSGKSTCLKVLIGLYPPSTGAITLDGKAVDMSTHREAFATVFADSYLFPQLLGVDHADEDQVNALLRRWGIGHKTRFEAGRFTRIALSTGQKKRVAMVSALLENKPFLVLDEWAADQDPEFRTWFYRTFLPELRDQGKTIIMASHDDRFFDIADQVLHFDYGRLREIRRKPAAPSSSDPL